jgi:serine/threonine-protein kinase
MPDVFDRLKAALADRYTIQHELGSGGMATVYLAEDLKHHRKVAVKVLRPELAAVLGAERFLKEIEVTANLQHPHILPLFDSGEADSFLYYVMPHVEGESLRDRLNRDKQLPVDEAVRIAEMVASALDSAHRHDIVHRDIKPENILLHEGQALVADFGIALAVSAAAGGRMTETGLSLGTPHYMSPEQATADRDVTGRSDVYSLACVTYEMLAGEPPYLGNTAQAIIAKIITDAPRPVRELRATVPGHVELALHKALEKLPADRFATAHDFAEALSDPAFRHGQLAPASVPVTAGAWRRSAMVGWSLATILAVALGWMLLRPEAPKAVERLSLAIPDAWVPTSQFSVSPDGSAIVFRGVVEGSAQLFLRRLDNLVASPVPGTEDGGSPVISPDGREVAFVAGDQLKVTRLQGGVVRTLADSAACCATWGPDGFVYYSRAPEFTIGRVPVGGGAVEAVTDRDQEGDGNQAFFRVLPGGKVAVFTVYGTPFRIEAMRLATGERKVLTPGITAHPLPAGYLMFATLEGRIMVAPFDAGTLELTGAAVPVIEGVRVGPRAVALYTVSKSGTVVYWTGSPASSEFELVWVARSGEVTSVDPGWTFDADADNRGWDLSPDETRLALKARTDLGRDIWIKELPDGPLSRLTFAEGTDRFPRWSPDGESVTFLSARAGELDAWTKRADGVGDADLLFDHEVVLAEAVWSPDGEWLILRTGGVAGVTGGRDILGLRPGVDSVPRPLVVSDFDEAGPAVSPDGRWLAYQSDETGRREVFIRPFPDTEGRKIQVSDGGGRAAVWAHSGRELFYVTDGPTTFGHRDLMVAEIRPGPLMAVVERRVLFSVPDGIYFANNSTSYLVTEDDQRFLMARVAGTGEEQNQDELILVQNFFEELKERVGN